MSNDLVATVCRTIATAEFKSKVQQALPPGVSLDRFTRTALTAIQMKPELARAEKQSLYNAVISAAQQGLLPDNREGAIVTYKAKDGDRWIEKAQFQPMVGGVVKRFGEAGILAYASSVYQNDLPKFRVWNDDTGQHIQHEPIMFGERGDFVGVYAVARTPDGRTYVEVMGLEEIDKVRAASKSKDREGNPVGPWRDWPERMAQKSVLHRLHRRVPISGPDDVAERLQATMDSDRELYDFGPAATTADTPAPTPAQPLHDTPRRPRGLQSVIDSTATVVDPQPSAGGYDDGSGGTVETAGGGDAPETHF